MPETTPTEPHSKSWDQTVDLFIPAPEQLMKHAFMPIIKPFGDNTHHIIESPRQLLEIAPSGSLKFAELVGLQTGGEQRDKTGGRVLVRGDGTIINIIPLESAQIWGEVATGLKNPASYFDDSITDSLSIPCAPILARNNGELRIITRESQAHVFSRYCGFSFATVTEVLPQIQKKLTKSANQKKLSEAIDSFIETISEKAEESIDLLKYFSYEHGHAHGGNFTIEFWPKDKFSVALHNNTLNTHIPEGITFDLRDYFKNQERYIPVVRLIDFDRIHINERGIQQMLPENPDPAAVFDLINKESLYKQLIGFAALRKLAKDDGLANGIMAALMLNHTTQDKLKYLNFLNQFYEQTADPHAAINKNLIDTFIKRCHSTEGLNN